MRSALCRLPLPGARRERARCRETVRVLQAYLDGEVDEATAEAAERHLETCRRCGLEATVYAEIKEALARRREPNEAAVGRLREFASRLPDEEAP